MSEHTSKQLLTIIFYTTSTAVGSPMDENSNVQGHSLIPMIMKILAKQYCGFGLWPEIDSCIIYF